METFIDRKKMQLVAATVRKRCKTFTKRKDWFIRIKVPLPPLEAKVMKEVLHHKLLNQYKFGVEALSWQICLEGSNKTDHHIQMCVKYKKNNEKVIKKHVRDWYDWMIEKYNINVKKINTFYSCVRIRENALRAMAYNYKEDEDTVDWKLDKKDVEIAKMLSHGKDLRQLSKQLEDLKESYFKNEITNKTLTKKILLLKSKFNQSIYINRIEAMVRYIMIKKDPIYADLWAQEIIDKITGN